MAYTSFKTRKALGKRYATDPALLMEMERLQNQYKLIPGREARAVQAEQFGKTMAFNESQALLNRAERREAAEQAGKASMIGTAGNVAMTGATLRAMTMKPGEKFFGGFGEKAGNIFDKGATTVNPATISAGASNASSAAGLFAGGAGLGSTQLSTAGTGVFEGAGLGGTSTGFGTAGGTAGGATGASFAVPELGSTTAAGAGISGLTAGLGVAGIELAKNPISDWADKQIGTAAGDVVDVGARAGQGALAGAAFGGPVGAGVGAVIGGAIGIAEKAVDTVICTELHRQGLMSDEIYEADKSFGKKQDTDVINGYNAWANVVVGWMRRSPLITALVKPIALSWAEHMAYTEGVLDKPNYMGAIIHNIGVPVCRFIGRLKEGRCSYA